MASSGSEDGNSVNKPLSRQKRGISFTGMLRDSLSLLVPSFVLDATTPKRRRVQEESTTINGSSMETNQNDNRKPLESGYVNVSNIHPSRSSTPAVMEPYRNPQIETPSLASIYPSLNDLRENPVEAERVCQIENSSSNKLRTPVPQLVDRPVDPQHSIRAESLFTSAKRTRLSDSQAPSSSMSCWTHTSGSSSSGSLLGEMYHQSPFYPGRISFGGASNYRRDAVRTRLNSERRSQTTVVPLRLNSVISYRTPSTSEDFSDIASASESGGPILSVATRRILRAMRRGTDVPEDFAEYDISGTTARTIRHQRHALWASCVRRRGRNQRVPDASSTADFRCIPRSIPHEDGKMFLSSSWPRDAIGVPPSNNYSGSTKQDQRLHSKEFEGSSSNTDMQVSAFKVTKSYAFSSPTNRSQPSTRPPSNASGADIGRSSFTFQSPPSRSASSNALGDLAYVPAPAQSNSCIVAAPSKQTSIHSGSQMTKMSEIVTSVQIPRPANFIQLESVSVRSSASSDAQFVSSPVLFSGSRTLPEMRPPVDGLPTSIPFTTNATSQVTKNAPSQGSWRCEACLAENAFLVTVCRVCQRAPNSAVVSAQREYYSLSSITPINSDAAVVERGMESNGFLKEAEISRFTSRNDNTLHVEKHPLPMISPEKRKCEKCLVKNPDATDTCLCCQSSKHKSENFDNLNNLISSNQLSSGKWRCETCFVENPDTKNTCVCCQSIKPKSKKCGSTPNQSKQLSHEKWRCETCLVENPESENMCVCCRSLKPKTEDKVLHANSKSNDMVKNQVSSDTPVCHTLNSSIGKKEEIQNSHLETANELWRCDTCFVENKASAHKCICCESPRESKSVDVSKGKVEHSNVLKNGGLLDSWKTTSPPTFNFGTYNTRNAVQGESDKGGLENATVVKSKSTTKEMESSVGIAITTSDASINPVNRIQFGVTENRTNSFPMIKVDNGNDLNKTPPVGGFKFGFGNVCMGSSSGSVKPISGFKFGSTNTGVLAGHGADSGFKFGATNFSAKGGIKFPETGPNHNDGNLFGEINGKSNSAFGETKCPDSIEKIENTLPNPGSCSNDKNNPNFQASDSNSSGNGESKKESKVSNSECGIRLNFFNTERTGVLFGSTANGKDVAETSGGSIFKFGESFGTEKKPVEANSKDGNNLKMKEQIGCNEAVTENSKLQFCGINSGNSLKFNWTSDSNSVTSGKLINAKALSAEKSIDTVYPHVSQDEKMKMVSGNIGNTVTMDKEVESSIKTTNNISNVTVCEHLSADAPQSKDNLVWKSANSATILTQPSNSIESLFSKSNQKPFKWENTDNAKSETTVSQDTAKINHSTLFDSSESMKLKRLTSSMSSPTLNTLPSLSSQENSLPLLSGCNNIPQSVSSDVTSSKSAGNNSIKESNKSSKSNDLQCDDMTLPGSSSNNLFVFGESSTFKQQSIFGSQPQHPETALNSTVPSHTSTVSTSSSNNLSGCFGNSVTSGLFGNSTNSNSATLFSSPANPSTSLFGNGSNSQSSFIFGSSGSLGNSSGPQSGVFQFGNQVPTTQSCFVFGARNHAPNSSASSNDPFGSRTPNPFSGQSVGNSSSGARPIKKAHRRLRK